MGIKIGNDKTYLLIEKIRPFKKTCLWAGDANRLTKVATFANGGEDLLIETLIEMGMIHSSCDKRFKA